jgi:RNA polymerase sigma-70 factor (ECF subfamily)
MPAGGSDLLTATAELSDEAIIGRILAGEKALFARIMRRHNQRLYRLARAMLRDDHEAEDALQETWIRAFQNLAQFEGRSRFFTWVAHIAVNECRARIRRRRRHDMRETRMSPHDAELRPDRHAPPPHQRAAAGEMGQLVSRAVDALPRQLRAVFVLREVEGMGTDDTALCLGLTPANVKVRLHRARRQLQESLAAALGEETRRLHAFDGERCDRIIRNVMSRIA